MSISISEILAEMEEGEEVTTESAEAWSNILATALASKEAGQIALGVVSAIASGATLAAVKSFIKDFKAGKSNKSESVEMEETIDELRNELNEVNLLNAKLLYTNKIFKAKNLTESDKVKVLNAFDKAENVKGVKLVYETLTESLKATSIAKKSSIKESLGSASRTIAPATPKQPIIESNEAFLRMQKIAGLIK